MDERGEGMAFDTFFDSLVKLGNDVFQVDKGGDVIGDDLARHEGPLQGGSVNGKITADKTEGRDDLRNLFGGEVHFEIGHGFSSFQVSTIKRPFRYWCQPSRYPERA